MTFDLSRLFLLGLLMHLAIGAAEDDGTALTFSRIAGCIKSGGRHRVHMGKPQLEQLICQARRELRVFVAEEGTLGKLSLWVQSVMSHLVRCGKHWLKGYALERYFDRFISAIPNMLVSSPQEANVCFVKAFPCDARYSEEVYAEGVRKAQHEVLAMALVASKQVQQRTAKLIIVSAHDQGKNMGALLPLELMQRTIWVVNNADVFRKADKNKHITLNLTRDVPAPGGMIRGPATSLDLSRHIRYFVYFSGNLQQKRNHVRNWLGLHLRGKSGTAINLPGERDRDATMRQSLFCLCPRGTRGYTPRLAQAIHAGCIPVLFQEFGRRHVLPYSCLIDWHRAAVFIPEHRLNKTYHHLKTLESRPQVLESYWKAIAWMQPLMTFQDPGKDEGCSVSANNLLLAEVNIRRKVMGI
jgi:hypothetical protein